MKHHTTDKATVNVKNDKSLTVLQLAVIEKWMPGVCMALEAGANINVTVNIYFSLNYGS